MPRVGILGFLHESNTFLPAPTTWDDFASTSMTEGEEMRQRWSGTHHELGGFFAGCDAEGLDAVPGFATFAVPSGAIRAADYERLADSLMDAARRMQPVDGLLVALHGATVSEDYPDADGEVLRRLRDVVGWTMPIVVTLDLHANVSPQMIRRATAITAYRSNPHLDQRERGVEAARLMADILLRGKKPVIALEAPAMAIPIASQNTSVMPARGLYADLEEVLTWPGILSASVCLGFYYADVEEVGTTFLAVSDGDEELAVTAVTWLADRAWMRRGEFETRLPLPQEAVAEAKDASRKPVVLMDVGDNVGGGSPADSTVLFAECLRQGARNALVVLYAPEAVQHCVSCGVRNEVEVVVNGLRIVGRVRLISDGIYVETQVRHGGWTRNDQGVTAVVETAEDHTVVLTSRRMAPMSLEQLLSLGIKPERKDILIVKGVIAPQAAYAPVAGEIVLVDTPGLTANDPRAFVYRRSRLFRAR